MLDSLWLVWKRICSFKKLSCSKSCFSRSCISAIWRLDPGAELELLTKSYPWFWPAWLADSFDNTKFGSLYWSKAPLSLIRMSLGPIEDFSSPIFEEALFVSKFSFDPLWSQYWVVCLRGIFLKLLITSLSLSISCLDSLSCWRRYWLSESSFVFSLT